MSSKLLVAPLAAVAAVAFSFASASAQEGPHMRNGLWEMHISQAGFAMSMKSCVSEESQKANSVFSSQVRKNNQCTSQTHTHNLDGSWTGISTCTFVPGRPPRTSRVDITGDFNSSYTLTLRSPPTAAPSSTMTARYLGPCLPGQRGGDVIANGTTINTTDMMRKN